MLLLLSLAFAADAAREAEATVVYGEATTAWEKGDELGARALLQLLLDDYADTTAARLAVQGALGGPRPPSPDAEAQAGELAKSAQEKVEAGDAVGGRAILEDLVDRFPDTRAARGAERSLRELRVVGRVAVPLAATKWFRSSATLADRPATLLFFFESWCPHCQREIDDIEALWKARGEGLMVVGLTRVTKSSTDEKVDAFLTEHGATFPVAKEDGTMSDFYEVSGIPAAALVRDGVVVWRGHPARLTDDALERLLR